MLLLCPSNAQSVLRSSADAEGRVGEALWRDRPPPAAPTPPHGPPGGPPSLLEAAFRQDRGQKQDESCRPCWGAAERAPDSRITSVGDRL